ncbi:MAG TPA: rod-binding protein [Fimbriimonadaceae bacterium]|jgi:flagellar protein FlgJ
MSEINPIKAQAEAAAKPQLQQLKKATDSLESVFVKDLLTEMQKGTNMFGKGTSAGIYQDMMNQELSKSIGGRGSLGISNMLYKQLSPRIVSQFEAQIRLRANSSQKEDKNSQEK